MCDPTRHDGSCTDCETDTWPTPNLRPVFREPTPPPSLPRDGGESETSR